jgi:hypothetical protein
MRCILQEFKITGFPLTSAVLFMEVMMLHIVNICFIFSQFLYVWSLYVERSGGRPFNFKYRTFPNIKPTMFSAKLYLGLKLPNHKTDNSAPSRAKDKNTWSFSVYMLSHINYFKLYLLYIINYIRTRFLMTWNSITVSCKTGITGLIGSIPTKFRFHRQHLI